MDLGGMADMLRNMSGGGSGEGGGNLASLLSNPRMMQMAEGLMANGGMERLMQNPSVASMVDHLSSKLFTSLTRCSQMNRMQSGGSMPSMAELMSDPGLREL